MAGQVICGACERKTQFKMAPWNRGFPERLEDEIFQQQNATAEIREESECCCRYCCHQNRELKLGLFPPMDSATSMGYENNGWPQNVAPQLVMERPFKCPLVCCCFMPWPWEMTAIDPQRNAPVGKAVFDWKWYNCCWPCDQHMDLFDGQGNKIYAVHAPLCCGGCCTPDGKSRAFRNFCAPTFCGPIFTATVHDALTGKEVAEWQNQWPGCNVRGVCQADSGASNYVVKYPYGASPAQKATILTGMFLANFIYFEQRANQKQ